jgi:hypothetical protein
VPPHEHRQHEQPRSSRQQSAQQSCPSSAQSARPAADVRHASSPAQRPSRTVVLPPPVGQAMPHARAPDASRKHAPQKAATTHAQSAEQAATQELTVAMDIAQQAACGMQGQTATTESSQDTPHCPSPSDLTQRSNEHQHLPEPQQPPQLQSQPQLLPGYMTPTRASLARLSQSERLLVKSGAHQERTAHATCSSTPIPTPLMPVNRSPLCVRAGHRAQDSTGGGAIAARSAGPQTSAEASAMAASAPSDRSDDLVGGSCGHAPHRAAVAPPAHLSCAPDAAQPGRRPVVARQTPMPSAAFRSTGRSTPPQYREPNATARDSAGALFMRAPMQP